MTTKGKLGTVFGILLGFFILLTIVTGGCNQAAPVNCPAETTIEGVTYGGCDANGYPRTTPVVKVRATEQQ